MILDLVRWVITFLLQAVPPPSEWRSRRQNLYDFAPRICDGADLTVPLMRPLAAVLPPAFGQG
jgi:hypothetical protein